MALFENYEGRIEKITSVLNSYGIKDIEEAEKITKDAGLDVYHMVEGIQNICFENAKWAYTVGAAIAIKKDCRRAADAAAAIGEGLQAFCIPGSVADHRKVGLGHGNLGKMLLEEETECFCFLAGHESFAAAEGAIGIATKANKVRQKPLRVVALFAQELCSALGPELLRDARDRSVSHYLRAQFSSAWAVFLAIHLGYGDLGCLNGLREKA